LIDMPRQTVKQTPKKPATVRSKTLSKSKIPSDKIDINRKTKQSLSSMDKSIRRVAEAEDFDKSIGRSKNKPKRGDTSSKNIEKLSRVKHEFEEALESGDDDATIQALSTFRNDFTKLREQMNPDAHDSFRVENSSYLFYRANLGMIMDILPLAEEAYRSSKKESAAYAMAALINLGRDLHNDLKMNEDVDGKAVVMTTLITQGFMRVADLLLREQHELLKRITAIVIKPSLTRSIKAEINTSIVSIAKAMDSTSQLLGMQMSEYMRGNPNYLNPHVTTAPVKSKTKRSKKTETEDN
jgi:type VI protein secretion system component VasK